MQTDMIDKYVLLGTLEQKLKFLSRLRAAALYGVILGILLLLFAGAYKPGHPLLPWVAGGLLSSLSLPLLFVAQAMLLLKQDAHRGLVRYLFQRGYREDYPEFTSVVDTPITLQMESRARPHH